MFFCDDVTYKKRFQWVFLLCEVVYPSPCFLPRVGFGSLFCFVFVSRFWCSSFVPDFFSEVFLPRFVFHLLVSFFYMNFLFFFRFFSCFLVLFYFILCRSLFSPVSPRNVLPPFFCAFGVVHRVMRLRCRVVTDEGLYQYSTCSYSTRPAIRKGFTSSTVPALW